MPSADELKMQNDQQQRITALMQETEAAKLEYTKHANTAGRLYRLKTNADFTWFLTEFVNPLILAESKIMDDRKTPDRERSDACHRKDMAKSIADLAEKKHAEFLAKSNPQPNSL